MRTSVSSFSQLQPAASRNARALSDAQVASRQFRPRCRSSLLPDDRGHRLVLRHRTASSSPAGRSSITKSRWTGLTIRIHGSTSWQLLQRMSGHHATGFFVDAPEVAPISSARGLGGMRSGDAFRLVFLGADATGGAFRHDWDRLHSGIIGPLHDVEGSVVGAQLADFAALLITAVRTPLRTVDVRRDGSIPTDSPARPGLLVFRLRWQSPAGRWQFCTRRNQSLAVEVVVLVVANLTTSLSIHCSQALGIRPSPGISTQQRQEALGCLRLRVIEVSLRSRGRQCIDETWRPHGCVLSA